MSHRFIIIIIVFDLFIYSCDSSEKITESPIEVKTCDVSINIDQVNKNETPIWDGINGGLLDWALSKKSPDFNRVYADGFRYLRFQETLHTIYTENDEFGNPIYNWKHFDTVVDRAVNAGFKLLIVLESTPDLLAKDTSAYAWTNRNPPVDYNKWYNFIRDVVLHCQERYGKSTIESWYWEVWNEPFASTYFYGTKSEYFKIHDFTISAVKEVNNNLKIGGNLKFGTGIGSDTPELFWLNDLIAHSLNEVNACTGKTGTPLDFISIHVYPLLPDDDVTSTLVLNNIDKIIKEIKGVMNNFGLSNIPLIVSEWNSTEMISGLRDQSYNAAFAVRTCKIFLENQIPRLYFHMLGDNPYDWKNGFVGSGGLFTASGIPKAVYHALTCMQKLYCAYINLESDDGHVDGLASIHENNIKIVCAHFETNPFLSYEKDVSFRFSKIPEDYKTIQYSISLIDDSHNNAYPVWIKMGANDVLTDADANKLREIAEFKVSESGASRISEKKWVKTITMQANSVVFIEIKLIKH